MLKHLGATALVGLVINAGVLAQAPVAAPPPTSYPVWEFGTIPRPALKQVLLNQPAVQKELKLTPEQTKAMGTVRGRGIEALLAPLEPRQRERLDQIQLQAQGPLAFNPGSMRRLALEGPDLPQRLKLSDDQVQRVRTIAEEGNAQISQAGTMPIGLDPKAGAPTLDAIRKLVQTSEFKAAKQKARKDARKAWDAVIERIEQVLTEPQRAAYHDLLGAPFDLRSIRFEEDESAEDATMLAMVLNIGRGAGGGGQQSGNAGGGGGGQRSDPDFDIKVAKPAYPTRHPRVLFDEAHSNFHTTDGRYKPFAGLIANDGYQVIPNKEKFTRDLLASGDILIIANALGADGMDQAGASNSAFSQAECDAVRDWVRAGGALLLITDHAPFGAAAESLARRFGVDMSKGYTSDPTNSEGGATSLVFTRKNHLLGDHPITQGRDDTERVDRVQTFTGQSLKGPAGSVAILKLGETAFDEGADGKPVSAAGRAQGIAFGFGDGRVVVMGEAAELSAQLVGNEKFGMNVPGLDNRKMALNILHWLSGLLEPRQAARE